MGTNIAKYIHQNQLFPRWAIAGRNYKKLSNLINELHAMGVNSGKLPDLLIVDATDIRGLRDLCLESLLVFNCVKPWSLCKDIIETAIMARCNYMDMCCDVHLIDSNFLEFHTEALKKGVSIIHGCSFDGAIPELGMMLARQISGAETCNSIESFLQIFAPAPTTDPNDCGCGYGTTAGNNINGVYHHQQMVMALTQRPMIDSLLNQQKYRKQAKQLQSKKLEKFKVLPRQHPGPKVAKKTPYYFDRRMNMFAIPSFGSEVSMVDHAFTTLSIRENQKVFPQYHAYVITDNYYEATTHSFYASLFQALAKYSMGRSIVRSFPETVVGAEGNNGVSYSSKEDNKFPTEEQLNATSFKMTFIARGFVKADEEDDCPTTDQDCTPVASATPIGLTRDTLNQTSTSPIPCGMFFGKDIDIIEDPTVDLSGMALYEKWVIVDGPEPYIKTSAMVAAVLAQYYFKIRYYNEKDKNLNVHSSSSMRNQFKLFGGVFTPSTMFHQFPFIYDALCDAGINFELYSPVLDGISVQLPTTTTNANLYQPKGGTKRSDATNGIVRINEKSSSTINQSVQGERLNRPIDSRPAAISSNPTFVYSN